MHRAFEAIEDIVRHDAGGRGLAGCVPREDLARLAHSLAHARRTIIVTGFPVTGCGVGETDGPPGAAGIARLMHALGSEVCVATDEQSRALTAAALSVCCPQAQLVCIPNDGAQEACRALSERVRPTHVIAIERPGKGLDGHFHNARGEIIDSLCADTDALLRTPGAVSVAIGDGGNELGMGALRPYIEKSVVHGRKICARERARFTLVSGVSNWWSWGLCALMSLHLERALLPGDAEERALVHAVVEAGGVDGVTRRREPTVDSLSLEQNLAVLHALRKLVQ